MRSAMLALAAGLLATMTIIFVIAVVAVTHYEQLGNPQFSAASGPRWVRSVCWA